MRLGIVTGLTVEQKVLPRLSGEDERLVRCFGPGPEAAGRAASQLLDEHCDALMSFGIAGALDPRLRPGSLVLAEAVVSDGDEVFATDRAWRRRLHACCGEDTHVWTGRVFGSARPLLSPAAKRSAASRFSAIAVDMESEGIGRMAARAGVPFVCLRAIADPAERGIPTWLVGTIDGRGKPRVPKIVTAAFAHLADVPSLVRLARDQRAALRSLRRVALSSGALLALR